MIILRLTFPTAPSPTTYKPFNPFGSELATYAATSHSAELRMWFPTTASSRTGALRVSEGEFVCYLQHT